MKTTDENLNSPITGQFKSSPFYIALASFPISGLTAIALTWVCYRLLPIDVAAQLAPQLQIGALGAGALGSGGGVLGMVKRGLDITQGKIKSQSPPDVPENINAGTAILNTGKSAAQPHSDALKDAATSAGTQILSNEVERATGFDATGLLEEFGVNEPFPRGVADTIDPTYFADGDVK